MEKDNENRAALALLNTANTSQDETRGVMETVPSAPGTLTPAATETAQAVPSPSPGGGNLYKPMFNVRTEKFIYVVCVLLGLGAIVVSVIAGDLNWPKVVSDTCGVMGGLVGSVASAFGVSYTTMRMV